MAGAGDLAAEGWARRGRDWRAGEADEVSEPADHGQLAERVGVGAGGGLGRRGREVVGGRGVVEAAAARWGVRRPGLRGALHIRQAPLH